MRKLIVCAVVLGAMLAMPAPSASAAKRPTCERPSGASLAEKRACFRKLVRARGLRESATPAELPRVAANLCDNDVAEMVFYIDVLTTIEMSPKEITLHGASVIDSFCPALRLQFDAAVDEQLGYRVPRPPRYV